MIIISVLEMRANRLLAQCTGSNASRPRGWICMHFNLDEVCALKPRSIDRVSRRERLEKGLTTQKGFYRFAYL